MGALITDTGDGLALALATKLVEGKSYHIATDNPDTASRARSIAALVGGTVASVEESDGRTGITFAPPRRQ